MGPWLVRSPPGEDAKRGNELQHRVVRYKQSLSAATGPCIGEMMKCRRPNRAITAVDIGAIPADISAKQCSDCVFNTIELFHSFTGVITVNPEKDRLVEIMCFHRVEISLRWSLARIGTRQPSRSTPAATDC